MIEILLRDLVKSFSFLKGKKEDEDSQDTHEYRKS